MRFFQKFYISLGEDCHPAHHMRRLGIRRHSSPFDWVYTPDMGVVGKILETRFAGFHAYESLSYYPDFFKLMKFVGCPVRDSHSGIVFGHDYRMEDFHDGVLAMDVYRAVDDKYRRRIDRFLRILEGPGNQVVFCRRQKSQLDATEDFADLLSRIYPKLNFRIFSYRMRGDGIAHVVDKSRVSYYTFPLPSPDYEGFTFEESWNQFQHIIKAAQI